MSQAIPPPPPPQPEQPPFTKPDPVDPRQNEMTIVSHSNLFYWWPVWAVCLVLGALTLLEYHVAAVLPYDRDHLQVAHGATVSYTVTDTKDGTKTTKDVKAENQTVIFEPDSIKGSGAVESPYLAISRHHSYGVVFTFVLLVVIFITNVPMRGMWSVIVIVLLAFLIVLFAYLGWWESVFRMLSTLDIRITAGGYFLVGTGLLTLWLVTFLFFDRQIYITVTPGNFKVCTEIGGGEQVYDTAGMKLEKHRSDLFRHWILGLGSGDLTVHTSGAQAAHVDLPNVLFIGRKVQQIENIIKQKAVVETR